MAKSTARSDAIEDRRAQVAAHLKAGLRQWQIAAQLGVAVGTVNRDIKIRRRRWRESQLADIEAAMLLDLERLDDALAALAPQVRDGHAPAIQQWVNIIRERSLILGYRAPARTEVAGRASGAWEVDVAQARERLAAKLFDLLRRRELGPGGFADSKTDSKTSD